MDKKPTELESRGVGEMPTGPEGRSVGETPADPGSRALGVKPAESGSRGVGEMPTGPEGRSVGETPADPGSRALGVKPAESGSRASGEIPAELEGRALGEMPAVPGSRAADVEPAELEGRALGEMPAGPGSRAVGEASGGLETRAVGGAPGGLTGRGGAVREWCVGAVVADRFDRGTWDDTYARSAGLRELGEELHEGYGHAVDLLTDVFLAAYKASPRLREPAAMDPSRLVNHRIMTALLDSPEFAELRRETAGDPYAAAMAVLAQAGALRALLERTRDAQDRGERAKRAGQDADDAATAVAEALREAAEDSGEETGEETGEGTGDDGAVRRAVEAAEAAAAAGAAAQQAAQVAATAVPGIRAAARSSAARAGEAVRQEAALMRAWGVGPGELERMPFAERARLAERLRTGRLAAWADLIGRFRQMASGERARKVENATGELVGVTLGDDLSRLIPSELANLGLPGLRAVFAARYAAGELMLYDSQGEQTTGRGAIIACVDTSHSMYEEGPGGITREAWSKACALALLDQARQAGRDFVGILFSGPGRTRVFRFPADEPAPVERTVDFAETFLGGGTSYQTPLSAAGDLLEAEFDDTARARGDIVMITDDDCGVTEQWTREWNATRHRLGFRLFGLVIGAPRAAAADSVLEALCDNLRLIEDLTDVHSAADLFRVI